MDSDVEAVVTQARLAKFVSGLESLGVEVLPDLLEVSDEELASIGLTRIQQQRFRNLVVPNVKHLLKGGKIEDMVSVKTSPERPAAAPASVVLGFEVGSPGDDLDSSVSTHGGGGGGEGEGDGEGEGGGEGEGIDAVASPAVIVIPSAPVGSTSSAVAPPSVAARSGRRDEAAAAMATLRVRPTSLRIETGEEELVSPTMQRFRKRQPGSQDNARQEPAPEGSAGVGQHHGDDTGVVSDASDDDWEAEQDDIGDAKPPLLASSFGAQAPAAAQPRTGKPAGGGGEPQVAVMQQVVWWKEVQTGDGYLYYYNVSTGQTQWEVPSETYMSLAGVPTEAPVVIQSLLPDLDAVQSRRAKLLQDADSDDDGGTGSAGRSPTHTHRTPSGSYLAQSLRAKASPAAAVAADAAPLGRAASGGPSRAGDGKASSHPRERTAGKTPNKRSKQRKHSKNGKARKGASTGKRARRKGRKASGGEVGKPRKVVVRKDVDRWRSTWEAVMSGKEKGTTKGTTKRTRSATAAASPAAAAQSYVAAPGSAVSLPSRPAPRLPPTILKGGYSGRSPLRDLPSPGKSPRGSPRSQATFWSSSLREEQASPSSSPASTPSSRAAYRALLQEQRAAAAPSAAKRGSGVARPSTTGRKSRANAVSVFARLTDVRSFTGTHRQRFDRRTGAGLGLAGRERSEQDLDDVRHDLLDTKIAALPVEGTFTPKSNRYFKF